MSAAQFEIPATVTAPLLAKILDVTPARVRQLVAEGWIKRSGRGVYPTKEAVHGYLRSLTAARERAEARTASQSTLQEARAREIEARTAQHVAKLMEVRDHFEVLDELLAIFREELSPLTKRLARNPEERARFESELQGLLRRVATRRAKLDAQLGILRG